MRAVLLTAALGALAGILGCSVPVNWPAGYAGDLAVYGKADGLYLATLPGGDVRQLDGGGKVRHPLISEDGRYAAYIKGEALYVASLAADAKRVQPVAQQVVSFVWLSGAQLAYAPRTGGLYRYGVEEDTHTTLSANGHIYDSLLFGDGVVYADAYTGEHGADGPAMRPVGVTAHPLAGGEEVLLRAEVPSEGAVGKAPALAGISSDGRQLFLWDKTTSASLSADGVPLGVYEVATGTYRVFSDTTVLPYADNLAVAPDGAQVAFVSGAGRGMNRNKGLVLLSVPSGRQQSLLGPGKTAMTPAFSQDGMTLYYAAREEQKTLEAWEAQPQGIWRMDLADGAAHPATKGSEGTDFAPHVLSDPSEVAFLRKTPAGEFALYVQVDQTERRIDSGLALSEEYYGHSAANSALAVYAAD